MIVLAPQTDCKRHSPRHSLEVRGAGIGSPLTSPYGILRHPLRPPELLSLVVSSFL